MIEWTGEGRYGLHAADGSLAATLWLEDGRWAAAAGDGAALDTRGGATLLQVACLLMGPDAAGDAEVIQADEHERIASHLRIAEQRGIAKAGFDASRDRAAMVQEFYEALGDRYSRVHEDPLLGPILVRHRERYGSLRYGDFKLARRIADVEAIRAIMALPQAAPAKAASGNEAASGS